MEISFCVCNAYKELNEIMKGYTNFATNYSQELLNIFFPFQEKPTWKNNFIALLYSTYSTMKYHHCSYNFFYCFRPIKSYDLFFSVEIEGEVSKGLNLNLYRRYKEPTCTDCNRFSLFVDSCVTRKLPGLLNIA